MFNFIYFLICIGFIFYYGYQFLSTNSEIEAIKQGVGVLVFLILAFWAYYDETRKPK